MAVLVVCGQRVRLVRFHGLGWRRGVLCPEAVGLLDKQGEPGRLCLHKWKTRRFELRGGSLYYYDPEDASRPKGVVSLSFHGVEVLSDGHQESSEAHAFVICTPTRNWCLRAPDAATKSAWVERLRLHIGQPECPLRSLEDIGAEILHDAHLLDLINLGSTDQLRHHLNLSFRSSITAPALPPAVIPRGPISAAAAAELAAAPVLGMGAGAYLDASLALRPSLRISTALARPAALHIQASWQRLSSFLGTPLRGCERLDGWLQPRSELPALPMQPCDLVWRPSSADGHEARGKSAVTPLAAGRLCGWLKTRPQTEDGLSWRWSSVQRRFCVLEDDVLRCYTSEEHAKQALSAQAAAAASKAPEGSGGVLDADAKFQATPARSSPSSEGSSRTPASTMSEFSQATTPSEPPTPRTPAPRAEQLLWKADPAQEGDVQPAALATIELCRVTRVRPSADPTAAPHAFEIRTLGDGGHERSACFEAPNGFEEADAWLAALRHALPAAAFEAPRSGHLKWNYFPDPLLANLQSCTQHPLSVMPPADEVAAGLLTLAEWHGLSGCGDAMAALRSATRGRETASIDLTQRRPHAWTNSELTLLFAVLMHSPKVRSLRLHGFSMGHATAQTSRAFEAFLARSVALERLELWGCRVEEAALERWTQALASNTHTSLSALALVSCRGLPRCAHRCGASLSAIVRSLYSPLAELELDDCGITGSALRAVLDALHRHERRFFTLHALRKLTLNSDTLHEHHAREALNSILRRASGLTHLRLLRSDRSTSSGAYCGDGVGTGLGTLGSHEDEEEHRLPGAGGGGGSCHDHDGGGGWFRSPVSLCEVLNALEQSMPPLECLALDGCVVPSDDELAPLALLRVATRFESLRKLSVGGTRLPADTLCAVVAMLIHSSSRPHLHLDCARNALGPVGGRKLAAVLRGAVAIRSLEAADNGFGPSGVAAIAAALRSSPCLLSFGLARNIRTPPRRFGTAPRELACDLDDDADGDPSSSCPGSTVRQDKAGDLPPRPPVDRSAQADPPVDAYQAFQAVGSLLRDPSCRLEVLDLSGDASGCAVPDGVGPLLLGIGRCQTLIHADVSGHGAGRQPGALSALLHVLRKSHSLRSLSIHRNAFDAASLWAVLGAWRRRNLTLQRLRLFTTDPRDPTVAREALRYETVRSESVASELMEEAEALSRRNRRLTDALANALAAGMSAS